VVSDKPFPSAWTTLAGRSIVGGVSGSPPQTHSLPLAVHVLEVRTLVPEIVRVTELVEDDFGPAVDAVMRVHGLALERMVGADGGVFTFGDAHFEGSCPGIGGCSGPAVAVMPDASGNGYWLVTATGNIYTSATPPATEPPDLRAHPSRQPSVQPTATGIGFCSLRIHARLVRA
jgi:hypothetical protein